MRQTERTISTFLNGLQLISQITENDKIRNTPGILYFNVLESILRAVLRRHLKREK